MMPYEAWRISYQSSEQAARDAYSFLQAAMRESETFKTEVENYKRITTKLHEEACEYTNEIASLQAKIDELMLEYCPDEMTEYQKANWAECQRPVGYDIGTFAYQNPVDWFSTGEVHLGYFVQDSKGVNRVIYKPESEGWIPWSGGECPVDGDTLVEVMFKGGTTDQSEGENWYWKHVRESSDIIAYRIV